MASQAFSKGGKWCSGDWGWWNGDNEKIASIGYQLERRDETNARLRLDYRRNDEPVAYTVTLIAEPCRFGGIRWFAICPHTGRKVSKLYLPPGATRFLARKTWRLAYRSQNKSAGIDRLCCRRDCALFRKLKSDDPELPLKPKWMRWKTYDGHVAKIDLLHSAMDREMLRRFGVHMI